MVIIACTHTGVVAGRVMTCADMALVGTFSRVWVGHDDEGTRERVFFNVKKTTYRITRACVRELAYHV